jgi:uncharacterized protein (TIRG00374 family)
MVSTAKSDAVVPGSHVKSAAHVDKPPVPNVRRMLVGMAGGLGVGIAVILIINPHIGTQIQNAERATSQPLYLLLALFCMGVVIAADAWSLLVLARVFAPRISRGSVVATALESHLIGGATSFGGFEIPYQIVMLRRAGLSGYEATSVVVFKGVVHTLLLAVVAVLAVLPWVDSPITSLQRWVVLGVVSVLLVVSMTAWLQLRRPSLRSVMPKRLRSSYDQIVTAARAFGGASRRQVAALVGLQFVYWVALFSVLICVLHALGWRGPVVPIITGQAVMQVLMPLSPLPGGAGVAELSYLALIGPKTPPSIHVSSLVLWRLFTWVLPVGVGAVSLGIRGARHGR